MRLLILLLTAAALLPAALGAAACPPAATPTPDSACGACATGARPGAENEGRPLVTGAYPGQQVGPDGYWRMCPPEPRSLPPLPCAGDRQPATWTVGGHTCTSALARDADERSSARRQPLAHGTAQALSQWTGPMRGTLTEVCLDGVRTTIGQTTCAPATHCDVRMTITRDGRAYVYDARGERRVPLGATVTARADDGDGLRLRCERGEFVARPQCAAGSEATRDFNSERRVYRIAHPLDVGQDGRAEQVRVERRRDGAVIEDPRLWTNTIRWTMVRCGQDGRLQ